MSIGVRNRHWVYTKPDIEEYGYFPIYIEKGIGDEFDVYPFTDNNVCKQIAYIKYVHQLQHLLFGLGLNSEMEVQVMALEVVVLDKDEYKALIDNQADEDELEYLKACQYALESFNKVRGLCPKCKKSVIIDGWVCPCCGYDSSGEELYKYGD